MPALGTFQRTCFEIPTHWIGSGILLTCCFTLSLFCGVTLIATEADLWVRTVLVTWGGHCWAGGWPPCLACPLLAGVAPCLASAFPLQVSLPAGSATAGLGVGVLSGGGGGKGWLSSWRIVGERAGYEVRNWSPPSTEEDLNVTGMRARLC